MSFYLDDDDYYDDSFGGSGDIDTIPGSRNFSSPSAAAGVGVSHSQTATTASYLDDRNLPSSSPPRSFRCANCGSTESYTDSVSGVPCCSSCFTQSQTQFLTEAEFDYDEVQGLAARVGPGGGRLVQYGRYVKRGNVGKANLRDYAEYDAGQPLPDVVECVNGMQLVLQASAKCVADLAGLDEKHGRDAMLECTRALWFGYLRAWSDGAEYFGKIHSDLRFSLRDLFLSATQRSMILRHLSYQATVARVKKEEEGDAGEEEGKIHPKEQEAEYDNDSESSSDSDASTSILRGHDERILKRKRQGSTETKSLVKDSQSNDEDRDDNSYSSSSSSDSLTRDIQNKPQERITISPSPNEKTNISAENCSRTTRIHERPIMAMLNSLPRPKRPKNSTLRLLDRKHAALRLQPSMSFVAAILYLALRRLRAGVSSYHITTWIANGSLPLLNAYHRLLPPDIRTKLHLIESFFQLRQIPSPYVIEYECNLICIACGMKDMIRPPMIYKNDDRRVRSMDNPFRRQYDCSCRRQGQKNGNEKEKSGDNDSDINNGSEINDGAKDKEHKKQCSCCHYYHDNIPLLAARIVADLGLGQRVLDIAYALMGVHDHNSHKIKRRSLWLPRPLPGASPDKLVSSLHVMAVIAVACKMCSGWESWVYHKPRGCMIRTTQLADKLNTTETKQEVESEGINDGSESEEVSSLYSDDSKNGKRSLTGEYADEAAQEGKAKRHNINGIGQRFVPWNEDQFRLLGNGPLLEGYLDFLEENIFVDKQPIRNLAEFVSTLQKDEVFENQNIMKEDDDSSSSSEEGSVNDETSSTSKSIGTNDKPCPIPPLNATLLPVRPNHILAGGPNPNRPPDTHQRQRHHDWHLRRGSKIAQWTEANGVGEYVIYKNRSLHSGNVSESKTFVRATPEPFHPHYGLLIEYMSYKSSCEPSDLHFLVSCLDEEVERLVCEDPIMASTRRLASRRVRKRWHGRKPLKRTRKRWKFTYESHFDRYARFDDVDTVLNKVV